jgi:hypothetical protein
MVGASRCWVGERDLEGPLGMANVVVVQRRSESLLDTNEEGVR